MADILVVDDESHIRKLYTELLSRAGYKVEAASSGEEALEISGRKKFDLIILDIELEDASGLEILKQLKAGQPDIPVILNSAYSIYKSDFNSWMADAYIMKSSDIKALKDKVEELVPV